MSDLPPKTSGLARLRNYFLTGFVICAPLAITVYLTWSFINWVDSWVEPYIPYAYNPERYLPVNIPGFGLIVAIVSITLIGFLTANIVGRSIVNYGESLLGRMPLVRNIYRGLKQILQTVLSEKSKSFQKVGLIEYPRRGLWAIVFIATDAEGEVLETIRPDTGPAVAVFLPTTPNPTSGFLLFVAKSDIRELSMSVEEAAKLVISAGLVTPEHPGVTLADLEEAAE
jgi:uncharacterized membrane protein